MKFYTNLGLADEIGNDKEAFANFYTFANIAYASDVKNLIDPDLELAAKAVHYLYKEISYDPNLLFSDKHKAAIEKRWADIEI